MFFLDLLPAGLWVRSGWYSKVKLLIKSIKPDLHNELSQNFQPTPFPSSLTHLVSLSFPASLRKAWLCQPVINPTCIKAYVCSKTNRAEKHSCVWFSWQESVSFCIPAICIHKVVWILHNAVTGRQMWRAKELNAFTFSLYRNKLHIYSGDLSNCSMVTDLCFFSFFFIKRAQISSLFKTNPGLFETFT